MEGSPINDPWVMAGVILAGIVAIAGLITAGFKIGRWVGAVNTDRKSFNAFMERVEKKLDSIFERLASIPRPTTTPDFPQARCPGMGTK